MADTGAPSKYDPKYCKEIIDYFSVKPYQKVGNNTEASDFPSFAGFAAQIGIHRETLRNWCEEHDEFFAAYKRAKELQENWMLINGNKGLVNTAFSIFTAKNVLGYKDKQPDEVPTTEVTQIINVDKEQLNEILKTAKGEK